MSLEQTINQDSDLFKNFVNDEEPDADLKITNELPIVTDITTEVDEDNELEITNVVPDIETTKDNEDDDEEEVDKNTDGDSDIDNKDSYSYKAFAKYLNDEGIVDFEDNDEIEDTPEVLFESVKKTIQKEIESYKNSIPAKAKDIIEYLEKGGDIDKYLNTIQKPFDIKDMDLNSESDQERIVREFLRSQDYTPEEINEAVIDAKDSLLLEKQATLASKKLDKIFSKKEQDLLSEQSEQQELQKSQYVEYINNIQNVIDTSTEMAGLPLSEKERKEFKTYLLAVDKEGKTQYQKDTENDPKTQIELAYLKFTKYDFSKAKRSGETEATKKLKDIFKKNEVTPKSAKEVVNENSDNDLSAFNIFKARLRNTE